MYREIERLNNYLTKWGVCYSVYDFDAYTINELLMMFLRKINESVDTVNEYTKMVIALLDYVKNEGLKKEVIEALDKMVADGTMNEIINDKIFGDLSDRVDQNSKDIQKVTELLQEYKIEINGTISDIKENLNNRLDIFEKENKEQMEKFKTELNKAFEELKNNISTEIDYIRNIREIDLRKMTPFTLGQFMSKKTRVVQGLAYNDKSNTFFISRVYSDDDGVAQSFLVAEYLPNGVQLSSCVCEYGGHGTVFGVEPVYNEMTKAWDSYIWTAWDVTNEKGQTIDYRVCRFKYSGSKKEGDKTIKITDREVQIIPLGTTEYCLVGVNATIGVVCIVKKGTGKYKPEFHTLENLKNGVYNKPIGKVDLNINDMSGLQGFALDEKNLYWRSGDASVEDDHITVYDWHKNEEQYNLNLRDMANPNKAGNEYMEGFKEPEGMTLHIDEKTGFKTIFMISSVGGSNRRKCLMTVLSQNGLSCPALLDSNSTSQKIAFVKPDGQVKDVPLNCDRLSDIREAGEYGLSSGEYARMKDKPDASGTDSSWRLFVGGKASSWDNTVLQTMVRNNAGHVDVYIRYARVSDNTDWWKIQTTRQ